MVESAGPHMSEGNQLGTGNWNLHNPQCQGGRLPQGRPEDEVLQCIAATYHMFGFENRKVL